MNFSKHTKRTSTGTAYVEAKVFVSIHEEGDKAKLAKLDQDLDEAQKALSLAVSRRNDFLTSKLLGYC